MGKSREMTLEKFAKKMGGKTKINVKKQTITETERELEGLAVTVLAAYFLKGVSWLKPVIMELLAGAAGIAVKEKLREPGKYIFTTEVTSLKIRSGALDGKYEKTFYLHTYREIEKYNDSLKKFETIYKDRSAQFEMITN